MVAILNGKSYVIDPNHATCSDSGIPKEEKSLEKMEFIRVKWGVQGRTDSTNCARYVALIAEDLASRYIANPVTYQKDNGLDLLVGEAKQYKKSNAEKLYGTERLLDVAMFDDNAYNRVHGSIHDEPAQDLRDDASCTFSSSEHFSIPTRASLTSQRVAENGSLEQLDSESPKSSRAFESNAPNLTQNFKADGE